METIAAFSFFACYFEDVVRYFCAFGVVAFGPVITRAFSAEDEAVGREQLAEGAGTNGVHSAGLEVDEDGPRNEPPALGLVEVDVYSFELKVGVAVVVAAGVDAVLVGN